MNLAVFYGLVPIVSMPMTPELRLSYRQKVDPLRLSISNWIDSRRHMWKKVLY